MELRFADFPGTNLAEHWKYVFAPRGLVEARRLGRYMKTRFDLSLAENWLLQYYPEGNPFHHDWQVLGSVVVIDSDDIAFAFKMRWF